MTAGMNVSDAALLSRALHIERNITTSTSTSNATVVPTIRARTPDDVVVKIDKTTLVTTTVVNEAGPTMVEFKVTGGKDHDHDHNNGHDDDGMGRLSFLD